MSSSGSRDAAIARHLKVGMAPGVLAWQAPRTSASSCSVLSELGQATDITPRPPVIDLSVHADVDIKSNQFLT